MSILVRFPHAARADVRIDLSCRQALVPQQFLHRTQIGSAIEQVGRKAVTQRMRRGYRLQPRLLNVLFQDSPNTACSEPLAELIREEWSAAGLGRTLVDIADFEPAQERLRCITADRRDAFFPPLAEDPQDIGSLIPVIDVEAHKFRDSQTGGVQCLEYCPIAQSEYVVGWRSFQQFRHLLGRQKVGQFSTDSRRPEGCGRIGGRDPLPRRVLKEAAECGQSAGGCRTGVLTLMQVRHVAPENGHGELIRLWNRAHPVPQVVVKTVKVFPIRFQRQLGGIAFESQ